MAEFINDAGIKVQQENRSVADLATQGFNPVVAPKIEAPAVSTPPAVINRTKLGEAITKTLQAPDVLGRTANKEFINSIAQFKLGRDASADELATGGEFGLGGTKVQDVLGRFGANDLAPAFGMSEVPKVEPTPTEPPKSGVTSAIDDFIAKKTEGLGTEVDTQAFLTKKQDTATAAEVSRQAIASKNLLDAAEIEKIRSEPISLARMQGAISRLGRDEQFDNILLAQDHNNNLILAQMAAGNFLEAQRINQSIASDNFQIEGLKIDKAREEQRITENEATILRQDEALAFERREAGFMEVDQATYDGLPDNQKMTVGGKLYMTPTPEVADSFKFVSGTENQESGFFNSATGEFTAFDTGGTSTSGGVVSTSTGDFYDIGNYATDPNHEASVQSILDNIGQFETIEDIDAYIQSTAPGSKITGQMVANASTDNNVSWEIMVAMMQQDSSLGTKGLGATNNNPGNIAQFDSLGTNAVDGYATMQEGVNAVAQNLSGRKTTKPESTAEDAQKDAILAQIRNGLLTKGDATDIREDYARDPAFLEQVTQAFTDPKNGKSSETQLAKFNAPADITKGQLDDIIAIRQENGFGNKLFQGVGEKEYKNVVDWLEMEKDLVSMRALKEGKDYISTLSPEEQERVFADHKDDFNVDTFEEFLEVGGVNTGPITGSTLGIRENLPGGIEKEKRQIALDVISGKYKVATMKEISGVAISEQEAKRLGALVPNIKLQDRRFISSAIDAQDSLNTSLLSAANRFGFDTIDEMRESTTRTRAGEFFDIDDETLANFGSGIDLDSSLSDDEAFRIFNQQTNQQ